MSGNCLLAVAFVLFVGWFLYSRVGKSKSETKVTEKEEETFKERVFLDTQSGNRYEFMGKRIFDILRSEHGRTIDYIRVDIFEVEETGEFVSVIRNEDGRVLVRHCRDRKEVSLELEKLFPSEGSGSYCYMGVAGERMRNALLETGWIIVNTIRL